MIPKEPKMGSFLLQFLNDTKKEKTLLISMSEIYVPGVTSHKVSNVVQKLSNKSFVADLAKQLYPSQN